jgi:NAD(P)-dependent dehydrogenase (short-subunit alcohol dehydrogenase family)
VLREDAMTTVNDGRFDGDVALVTGSNMGIGAATVERLAKEGASVVVTGRDEERGQQVADDITDQGHEATFLQADLADPAHVEALVDETVATYGGLDVLVNNAAAPASSTAIEETTLEEWATVVNVNLRAAWLTVKNAVPHFSEGSSVVNVSSNHALETEDGRFPYNVTKTAINGLTRSMAIELGPETRVNTVVPGWIPTHGDTTGARRRELANLHPVGRLGRPEDIAATIAFLASEDAAFVTGAALLADGGRRSVMYDQLIPDYAEE